MKISHSDFEWKISKNVIIIKDLNKGRKSVTNDMENIINEIFKKEGNKIWDFSIIYRDSDKIWDGVIPTWTIGGCSEVSFYPIREIELEVALSKIKILRK